MAQLTECPESRVYVELLSGLQTDWKCLTLCSGSTGRKSRFPLALPDRT